jgi:hypothetical protein
LRDHTEPTSCAIRGARGRGFGHRSPPGPSGELGWAGCGPGGPIWPLGRWVRRPVTPTGTGAAWLLCRPSHRRLPAGGLSPRVFSAHRLFVAEALSTGFGNGAAPHCWHCVLAYPDRQRPPSTAKPFPQPGQILCRFRLALQRTSSGPRIALPAHRLHDPVGTWPRSTTRGNMMWTAKRHWLGSPSVWMAARGVGGNRG